MKPKISIFALVAIILTLAFTAMFSNPKASANVAKKTNAVRDTAGGEWNRCTYYYISEGYQCGNYWDPSWTCANRCQAHCGI